MWVGRPSHRRGEGPCRIPAGSPVPSSRSGTGSAPAPAGTPIPTCSFPPTADAARGGPPGRRRRRRSAGAARCGGGARRMPWPRRSPTASGAGCPRRTGNCAGGSPPPAVVHPVTGTRRPFRAPPAARTSVHYARSSAGNLSLGSNGRTPWVERVGRLGDGFDVVVGGAGTLRVSAAELARPGVARAQSAARPGRGVRAEACRATSRRWKASWPRASLPTEASHHVTFDRGHGRTEIREITTTSHVAAIDFPGVFQAVRIRRETCDLYDNLIRRPETVYGITSLTAQQANPADLLAHNRGHWQIENREHYVRDRTYDEDRSQVRTGSAPQVMAPSATLPSACSAWPAGPTLRLSGPPRRCPAASARPSPSSASSSVEQKGGDHHTATLTKALIRGSAKSAWRGDL